MFGPELPPAKERVGVWVRPVKLKAVDQDNL
jgi:hypothetical protein